MLTVNLHKNSLSLLDIQGSNKIKFFFFGFIGFKLICKIRMQINAIYSHDSNILCLFRCFTYL